MTPTLFLRIAAGLAFFHCVTHTLGGVLSGPSHGADEIAVLDAMRTHRFDFMGSLRSYWDFFFGYGWIVAIVLASQGVVWWQLGAMARRGAVALRPVLLTFAVQWAVTAVVSGMYFFVAPAATQVLMAACLMAAWAKARA